jgi:hypothetical protein
VGSVRLRTFLIGLLVAVLLLLAAGCGVVVFLAGSLQSGEHPEFDFRNPEISADRAAIVPELEAQLDAMEARYGHEHVGPRWRIDWCEEGQDNFMRTDGYAYSCRMEIVQLMAVGKPFEANASRLGEALLEGRCPNGTDTDRALAEPYHSHPGQLHSSTGDCAPEWGQGPWITKWLPARPTAEEVESAGFYLQCGRRSEAYCDAGSPGPEAADAAAPADAAYLAIVVVDEDYHSVPWDCPWPASWVRDICQS